MFQLSIGALIRNEEHSIVEWIEHHLFHGVEHFYLIDDASDDTMCDLLKPYVDAGTVTLFKANFARYLGRQRDMYNTYLLPIVNRKETQWLLLCDADEYVWSQKSIDLRTVLADCMRIGQIQITHTLFGSSGFIEQPRSIVQSFIRRHVQIPTNDPGNLKYIVNSNFKFTSLNVHHATFENIEDEKNHFLLLNNYFRLNHYNCQSKQFWDTVKCVRGSGDFYKIRKPSDFIDLDFNEVEDRTLLLQNEPLLRKLGYIL